MCAPCVSPLLSGTLQVLGLCLLRAQTQKTWTLGTGLGSRPGPAGGSPCGRGWSLCSTFLLSEGGSCGCVTDGCPPVLPVESCEASVRKDRGLEAPRAPRVPRVRGLDPGSPRLGRPPQAMLPGRADPGLLLSPSLGVLELVERPLGGTVATAQPPSSLSRHFPTSTLSSFHFLFLTQHCMQGYGIFSHSWILRGWNNDKKLLQ